MGILAGKQIVIMGLLNTDSIAWAIGQAAIREGANVIYTVQNQRYIDTVLKKSFRDQGINLDNCRIFECDIQDNEQIARLFKKTSRVDGLVYSIAYANSQTCLGDGHLWDAPRQDIQKALDISGTGFVYVAGEARHKMSPGSSIIALTFESQVAFPNYNVMGPAKCLLEGFARGLALDLEEDGIRVNCLSSGPLSTMAARSIPGFEYIARYAQERSLNWDPKNMHGQVANSATYLLSDYSTGVNGTVHYVDGGAHAIAMRKPKKES